MKFLNHKYLSLLAFIFIQSGVISCGDSKEEEIIAFETPVDQWPKVTKENKPWTRWWWMGSAVDKENIDFLLKEYERIGLGGVEIAPIYGAKGFEDRYLEFLSPEWISILKHTVDKASELDLGVDLTQGTGWPFGGPQVKMEHRK